MDWGHFDQVLASHGIGFLTGTEITVDDGPEPFHLLAYGFDPENQELCQILHRRKMSRRSAIREDINKIAGYLRSWQNQARIRQLREWTDASAIVQAIHQAGGSAFLGTSPDDLPGHGATGRAADQAEGDGA